MGTVHYLYDTLVNFVTGLGTMKDPSRTSSYSFTELNRNDLENAYRGDWIARRIVDAPAEDMTREWRDWQANQDQIEAIEEVEKALDLQRKLKHAISRARLYGGAALVLGVQQGETYEPIDLEQVGEGDLKFVVVMNRYELSAGQRIYDVNSPWYTRPEYYTVSTPMYGFDFAKEQASSSYALTRPGFGQASTDRNLVAGRKSGMIKIHPSRVVELVGNELPDWRLAPLGGGWGDSVLQTVDDTLKDWGMIIGGTANMVNDGKVDVLKIPDFSKRMATKEYAGQLLSRLMLANQAKSTLNTLVLDKEEEWSRIQSSFNGLPNLIKEFMSVVAGAGGIPVTRLMGSAPSKGLSSAGGSGGEVDLRNYYDDTSSKQKTVLSPALSQLDQIIVRSALGKADPSIYYEWAPLWQMDEKDKSTVAQNKANTTKIYVETGLINEDALRSATINQLLEDGTYPGLDDAIDEFGDKPEEPDIAVMWSRLAGKTAAPAGGAVGGPPMPKQIAAPVQQQGTKDARFNDATPRTLYVRRDVINADEIVTWAKSVGFSKTIPPEQMHVTVVFSRAKIDWMTINENYSEDSKGEIRVASVGPRLVERLGATKDAVVLMFNSSALSYRHESIAKAGASWDWPEYQPHITISFDAPDIDVTKIEPYRGAIILGPEIFEEVKEDWKSTIKEDAAPAKPKRRSHKRRRPT